MKALSRPCRAFTLIELVIVTAILGLFTTLFVRAQLDPQDKARRERQMCVTQLKQVGLAFRIWSNDNNEKFPMQVEAKKGGSMEAIKAGEPYRHFQAMANELLKAKLLACPADNREAAADFQALRSANISYFVGLEADEARPQMLLAGDRNITNGLAPKKGILELNDKPAFAWTERLHNDAGNLGLADGSVQQATTELLRRQVEAAKKFNDGGLTRIQLPEAGSSSAE